MNLIRSAFFPWVLVVTSAAAQTTGVHESSPLAPRTGNVLMLVMDEVGPDMIGAYGIGTDLPPTPNLDALAADGVLFRSAYSNPAGSVTMATIETGRIGELTGIGFTIYSFVGDPPLPLSETILPEMLDAGTGGSYSHAMFGKWFLGKSTDVGGVLAPNTMGYGHYEGVMEQLYVGGWDYFLYPWVVDGVEELSTVYATTKTVDTALAWIGKTPQPWFCHIAFHSAHTPLHEPPAHLHTQDLPTTVGHGEGRPWFKAMVEAIDTEVGRLLASMSPAVRARTTVIVLSDNGTPGGLVAPPFPSDHGKLTVYEGGINVPMIVSGYGVQAPGREEDALVSTTDLFATIAELAGVDLEATLPGLLHQSVSLVPYLEEPSTPDLRDKVFSEMFYPNGIGLTDFITQKYAARGPRYKVIRSQQGAGPYLAALYDLWSDPFEQTNLLLGSPTPEEQAAFQELDAYIAALVALP